MTLALWDHKVLKAFKVLLEQQDPQVLQDHKAHKASLGRRDPLDRLGPLEQRDQKVIPEQPELSVLQVLLAHRGSRAILARPAPLALQDQLDPLEQRGQKVTREQPELSVLQVLPAHRGSRAILAQPAPLALQAPLDRRAQLVLKDLPG